MSRINEPNAIKSFIESYQALNRVDATTRDLAQLHAVSQTTGACADLRAETVATVPLRVVDNKTGEDAPASAPLSRLVKSAGMYDLMYRTELSMFYWGHNLLAKQRNAFQLPMALRWINPTLYMNDVGYQEGLRGFRIYSGAYKIEVSSYLPVSDAVYMHGVDFDDDFDGVSPAERCFLEASIEPERAQTALALFRNMGVPAAIAQPAPGESAVSTQSDEGKSLIALLRNSFQSAINAGRTMVTMKRWEWLVLQSPVKDMAMAEIAKEARDAICVAARVPTVLIMPTDSTFANLDTARRFWGQTWLIPRMNWYAAQLTQQLAREYGDYTIAPDFDAVEFLQQDAAAKTAVIKLQVDTTLITLYDAQKQAGLEPDDALRGLYMVGGVPVPKTEIANLWKAQYAQPLALPPVTDAPPMGNAATAPLLTAGDVTITAPDATQAADAPSLWIGLYFDRAADLVALQSNVKRLYPDGSEWTAADDFHITLAYAPAVTDEQIAAAQAALADMTLPDMALRLASLRAFDSVGTYALHFRVRHNDDLRDLQEAVYDALDSAGVALSSYSVPSAWLPHITMGYTATKPRMTAFSGGGLSITPTRLALCKGDDVLWEVGSEDDPPPPAPTPDDAAAELKALGKKARNKGAMKAAQSFVFDVTPPHVGAWALDELAQSVDADNATIDAMIADALAMLAVKAYSDTRADFARAIEALITAAHNDETKRRAWAASMRATCRQYGLRAYVDGMQDGGAQGDGLSQDDVDRFRAWQSETSGYITAFGAELFKEGGITDAEVPARVEAWCNKTLNSIYYAAYGAYAALQACTWRMGNTIEHCDDCRERDGQTKTFAEWQELGLPQSSVLACHGDHCACGLFDSNGKIIGVR